MREAAELLDGRGHRSMWGRGHRALAGTRLAADRSRIWPGTDLGGSILLRHSFRCTNEAFSNLLWPAQTASSRTSRGAYRER